MIQTTLTIGFLLLANDPAARNDPQPRPLRLDDPEAAVEASATTTPEIFKRPRYAHPYDHHESWSYIQLGAGLLTTSSSDGPGEEIDFDEGYAVPIAIGHRFGAAPGSAVAYELEFEAYWSDTDTDDPDGPINAVSDITTLGGLVNGGVDLAVADSVSLYGGGGIGLSYLDVGTQSDAVNDFEDEDGPFLTWQVKAGVRWYANRSTSFNFGYRFVNVDDVEVDDDLGGADFDLQNEQHVLEFGMRFAL